MYNTIKDIKAAGLLNKANQPTIAFVIAANAVAAALYFLFA